MPNTFWAERFREEAFEKEFTLDLKNGTIQCKAVSEDCVFYGENGQAEATLFLQAYIRTDLPAGAAAQRPVMFLWNGGPGSASSMLQLECFGPWLIDRDENEQYSYGIHTDPDCVLDQVDLVYIDQVGVGYSRLLDTSRESKYCCIDGDARAYAFAILKWLKRHSRMNSPMYICGESYGTVRACRVAAELGRSPYSESRMVPGIPAAGIILVGNATSMAGGTGNLLEAGLQLTTAMMPAMAATNWYHHPDGKGTQEAFVAEAWAFAGSELQAAYFAGRDLPAEQKQAIAKKLAYYTGMQESYFLRTGLKVSQPDDFMMQVCADTGCRVDLYDGRLKFPLSGSYNAIGGADNVPLKVMNSLMAENRGITTDRTYFTGNLSQNWGFETEDLPFGKKSHIGCMEAAMAANPNMRLLFASGLYDLCTHAGNTRYQFAHSTLPEDRTTLREYPGGHGVYSTPEGKARFLQDVRDFIAGKAL